MEYTSGRAAAVIVAGGSGTRFGSDKLTVPLAGLPVLARTLRAFEACDAVDAIVLVTRADFLDEARTFCARYEIRKLCAVVPGGRVRAESCAAGLAALPDDIAIAAIHDGARPLVSSQIIAGAIEAARKSGASVPAVPVRDTIKQARDGKVLTTPDRSELYAVQTPQCFRTDIIRPALARALREGAPLTDDCSAAELYGSTVVLTAGSEENIKITTPLDIALAEVILKRREGTL